MKQLIRYRYILFIAILGVVGALADTSRWSVQGTKVKLNGQNFIFQGVNYAPTPYGASTQYTPPHGSYFIPKAKPVWQRDIDLMRQMGVNSIRLYAGTNSTVDGLDLGDYQDFLDYLYNDGTDSIYVFLYFWHEVGVESKTNPSFATYKQEAVSLLSRWKDHPAVAGFVIGNETEGDASTWGSANYWQGVGEVADALKAAAPDKLVINAMIDDGNGNNFSPKVQAAYANKQFLGNLDIIGINCYRGADLGTEAKPFGSAASNSVFLGYARSWPENPKPMLVTEFGVAWGSGSGTDDITEADSPDQVAKGKNYMTKNWTVIRNNYQSKDGDTSVCVGGFVFSWVDEWYKIYIDGAPTATTHNSNLSVNTNPAFPGGRNDEEWFGIMRIDTTKVSPSSGTWDIEKLKADTLIPRGSFDALKTLWKTTKTSAFTAEASSVATPNDDGTWDTWFGIVYEDNYPWVYQFEHDWAYAHESENGSAWIWDESFGEWFWTSEEVYPWLFRQSTGNWVYYFEGTNDPQYFWDSGTGDIFTHMAELTPAQ